MEGGCRDDHDHDISKALMRIGIAPPSLLPDLLGTAHWIDPFHAELQDRGLTDEPEKD